MINTEKQIPIALTSYNGIIYSYYDDNDQTSANERIIDSRNIMPISNWHKNAMKDGFIIRPNNIYFILTNNMTSVNGRLEPSIELESIGVQMNLYFDKTNKPDEGFFTIVITTNVPVKVYSDTVWAEITNYDEKVIQ